MRSHLAAGAAAGLLAGIPFGIMMSLMMVPTPTGGRLYVMEMVGLIPLNNDPTGVLIPYSTMTIGWVYHLVNSAIIGLLFALLAGAAIRRPGPAMAAGTLYGLGWWILGGLVLMPVLLGMEVFAPLAMTELRPLAWGGLLGHLLYGLVLGPLYVGLHKPGPRPEMVPTWRRLVHR